MYYKYFIDFLGTLTILYSKIYTDANPPIMGLVYFAMFYLGKGVTEGFFSPLAVFVQYSLGRINATDAMYYLLSQYSAAILIILTFIPIKTFMQRMI
jgi:hypothetical protein